MADQHTEEWKQKKRQEWKLRVLDSAPIKERRSAKAKAIADQQYYLPISHYARTRGDLRTALASQEDLAAIWPESARPAFMLTHGFFSDHLTVKDIALFEIMLSWSREHAPDQRLALPVSCLLRLLGWTGNKRHLVASLERLQRAVYNVAYSNTRFAPLGYRFRAKGEYALFQQGPRIEKIDSTDYGQVGKPSECVVFCIGGAIRQWQGCRLRYHYVEIGAMAQMGSKYSIRLYQALIYQTWKHGTKYPGTIGVHSLAITPRKLARRIGWLKPGRDFNFAVFKREVLDRADHDLAHVRAFSMSYSVERGPGRGNPVAMINFKLVPAVPDWRRLKSASMESLPADDRDLVVQNDDPKLRPSPAIWLRASRHWGVSATLLYEAWQIALYEALHNLPVNNDVNGASRGASLLSALTHSDPSDAAWEFVQNEISSPSLMRVSDPRWKDLALCARTQRVDALRDPETLPHSEQALIASRANVLKATIIRLDGELRAETEGRLMTPAAVAEQPDWPQDSDDAEVNIIVSKSLGDTDLLDELLSNFA